MRISPGLSLGWLCHAGLGAPGWPLPRETEATNSRRRSELGLTSWLAGKSMERDTGQHLH